MNLLLVSIYRNVSLLWTLHGILSALSVSIVGECSTMKGFMREMGNLIVGKYKNCRSLIVLIQLFALDLQIHYILKWQVLFYSQKVSFRINMMSTG